MNARTEPPLGLTYGMPIDQYHASPGISNSGLRDFARSPAHFYGLHMDPARPAREEKAGQLEGTLAHCAILEPEEFDKRYAVGPNCRRGTKIWDTFEEQHPGMVCIKPDQYHVAMQQAAAVRALPDVQRLLSAGRAEVSVSWVDETTGELCRCRPDWVHTTEHGVILMDVKTYSDASPQEFARQVARKAYHCQDAWYSTGYEIGAGVPVIGFVFVAVESEWPHAASACMLDDESRAKGREINRELLFRYSQCKSSGIWPGYSQQVEMITLPAWA